MAEPTSRREAGKQARRAALMQAAHRLFAERGYEATTVRDIAAAAGLTERTFYRYFDGKEGLLAEEYQNWLQAFREAIAGRPERELPLTAIRNAVLAAAMQAGSSHTGEVPAPVWLFQDRPFAGLRHLAPRPLVRLETAVADAILARLRATPASGSAPISHDRPAGPGHEYQAQVIARVAVAVLRTAAIRHRQLRHAGEPSLPDIAHLLDQAFSIISEQQA